MRKLGRPPVTLENREAVATYYRHKEQSPFWSWVGYTGMGLAVRPHYSYDPGAPEAIRQVFDERKQFAIVPKHAHFLDQFTIAGSAARLPFLRGLMGKTSIGAKASLFNATIPVPGTKLEIPASPLRWAVDEMGAQPRHRPKDITRQAEGMEARGISPKAIDEMRKGGNGDFHDIGVEGFRGGEKHEAEFTEGTRHTDEDPTVVHKVLPGFGRVLEESLAEIDSGVSQSRGIALLPMGIYYGEDEKNLWTPNVHIGLPELELPPSAGDITGLIQVRLQDSLDIAVDLAGSRN